MHLARQKVQMTFFSRANVWRSEKGTKNCSFCGESHSSCSQKEQFFCPFLMHLARQKVQMTFFSRKMTFRKEQKNCSFCGESHSSCSQKEQFFCPFLMHLARQKVQMTFFSRKDIKKGTKNCSFCGESHSSCSQKEQFFCPFLMHLARQKVQMTFFSRKMTFRKEQKIALFVERAILHVVKRNNFFVLFWCIWQGKKYKWRSFLERWRSERNKKLLFLWREPFFM